LHLPTVTRPIHTQTPGTKMTAMKLHASRSNSKILSNVYARQRVSPRSHSDAYQTEHQTESASPYRSNDDNTDGFFGDANPTFPDARTNTNAPSGSAWDRIRQSASPTSSPRGIGSKPASPFRAAGQPPQGQQNDSSGFSSGSRTRSSVSGQPDPNSSFSITEGGELPAKEQAQRDFDRLIEKERRISADRGDGGGERDGELF